jgi:hypothetical protein
LFRNTCEFIQPPSGPARKDTTCPSVLSLKQYLAAEHIGVGIWGELQPSPINDWRESVRSGDVRYGFLISLPPPLRSGHAISRDRSKSSVMPGTDSAPLTALTPLTTPPATN